VRERERERERDRERRQDEREGGREGGREGERERERKTTTVDNVDAADLCQYLTVVLVNLVKQDK
jgi:hypothetical protein